MTTTKHTDCTHPATKSARAACRKGKAVEAAPIIDANGLVVTDYSAMNYSFETETCFRCSGTGTYPSSAWNGVCLGCNGSGKKLTRAGMAAKKAHDAWIADHLMISVLDVEVGMKIKPSPRDGFKTITAIGEVHTNGTTKIGDAEPVANVMIDFTTLKSGIYSMMTTSTVQRAATAEERNALVAHIAKRKGTILTEKA